jgi:dihydropteridine reductase
MSVLLRRRSTWGLAARCSASSYSVQRDFSSNSYSDGDFIESRQKTALVIGSSGCLGSSVVRHLGKNLDMKVVGADVVGLPEGSSSSSLLDAFIQLPTFSQPAAVADVTAALMEGLTGILDEEDEIDAIICACGGWMGDPPFPKPDDTDEDFMKGAKDYGDTINKMLEMNLYPVLAAGYAANRFMADEGKLYHDI